MKSNYDILGNHIRLIDTRNRESITDRVLGINIDKVFMPSVANVIGTDLSKYKLITKGKFACNPMHVGRDERLPVALYDEEEPAIVSPAYFMFEVVDNSILNEDYLMMWFRRPEFDRICWLHTDGSVRGGITWDDICRLELPIPPIEKQLEIVNSYKAITERIALKKKINDNLATQALTLYSDFVSHRSKKLEQRKLGDVIASANTGGDAIQKVPIVDYDTGIKCARVGDITNAREYASWAFCNASKSVYDNYKLQAGDILVTRTATLGITQYIAKDISAVYNNGLIRLKVDDTNALPLYIYWAMKTSDFLNYINQMNSATSVRPNMKIDYLLNYQLSISSIEEQTQFTNAVEPLMKAISLNNDEILKLSEFQAIILTTLSSR